MNFSETPDLTITPGNVRELEQAIRRVLLTRKYQEENSISAHHPLSSLAQHVECGSIDAQSLIAEYCAMLFDRHGTYEKVGQITRLDRRTVKKYIQTVRDK